MASKSQRALAEAEQERNELHALLLAAVIKAGGEVTIGKALMPGAARAVADGSMYVSMSTNDDGDTVINAFRAEAPEGIH